MTAPDPDEWLRRTEEANIRKGIENYVKENVVVSEITKDREQPGQALLLAARTVVFEYCFSKLNYGKEAAESEKHMFTMDDVYIVWFNKTLRNWKALVSTTVVDDRYYEVTYNGEKGEIYLDAYKKVENLRIPWQ